MISLYFWAIIFISVVILAFITGFIIYNSTFKNVARIARQTGKDDNSVIWVTDKFKVINKDGEWHIKFKNMRVKTQSIDGNKWTTFFKPKDVAKELKMTKDEWANREMSKKIQRGLILYEDNHGELKPMEIVKTNKDGVELKVLGQDNRRWLVTEIKEINSLTRNRKQDMLYLLAFIVCALVMGVVFIFGIIYMNEQGTKALSANQEACTKYIDKLLNYTQEVKNEKGFAQQTANVVVGG